jgi:threonine dehydratase
MSGQDRLLLKCENLQKTGSFKVRGALNHILTMDPDARARGVVTISAGNHAQAVAWAAGRVETRATVVMPRGASPTKARASEGYGAEVIIDGSVHEAFGLARDIAQRRGMTFLHPFDDPAVIAGQGTVGIEVLEQVPHLSTVVVPVGGGGQIAGVCAGLGELRPDVRIFGVEPEGAAAMRLSLERGVASRIETVDTIADGLAPPMAGELTFAHVQARVEDVVTVTDAEIAHAMSLLLSRAKLLTEPAGAAAVAALVHGKITPSGSGAVVAIVTGGNVDLDRLPDLLALAG